MRLKINKNFSVLIVGVLFFSFVISRSTFADSHWERLLEQGQLKQGMAAAVTAGVPVDEIGKKALEVNYPVCDLLVAMLNAEINAYLALNTIITKGGDVEQLAKCCAEPNIGITSAVFAKAAIDAGLESDTVDRLLRLAFTPPPEESGIFTRESVVAGGEIREGPYASPYSFGSPSPSK